MKDKEALDDIREWTTYHDAVSISKDSQFVVYVKVTDEAGNYNYASSGGVIFDATKPRIDLKPADGNTYENGFFTGDVLFNLFTTDALPSSGIKSVDYVIAINNEPRPKESLYTFDADAEEQLVTRWPKDIDAVHTITVPCEGLKETDEVKLTITVEDLAGNIETHGYGMNVISEAAEVSLTPIAEGYYQTPQETEITVAGKPNSFDEKKVNIVITAKNALGENVAEDVTSTYKPW